MGDIDHGHTHPRGLGRSEVNATTSLRRPTLAPLYALVISFGIVMLLGLFLGDSPTVIQLKVDGGGPLPADLAVGVRDPTTYHRFFGENVDGTGRFEAPDQVSDRLVCVKLPAGWLVSDPTTQRLEVDGGVLSCTDPVPNPAPSEIVLTLTRDPKPNAAVESSDQSKSTDNSKKDKDGSPSPIPSTPAGTGPPSESPPPSGNGANPQKPGGPK